MEIKISLFWARWLAINDPRINWNLKGLARSGTCKESPVKGDYWQIKVTIYYKKLDQRRYLYIIIEIRSKSETQRRLTKSEQFY